MSEALLLSLALSLLSFGSSGAPRSLLLQKWEAALLRSGGSKSNSKSPRCTLPQNKVDSLMEFLGPRAGAWRLLLLVVPLWVRGPGTMVI